MILSDPKKEGVEVELAFVFVPLKVTVVVLLKVKVEGPLQLEMVALLFTVTQLPEALPVQVCARA